MATDVEICSNALLLLGAEPISSFTEESEDAGRCANIYPLAKAEVLRAHNWNCCTRRKILSPETTTPDFDWRYQFARPSGWIRTLQVGYADQPLDYVTEGTKILANTNVLPIVYVADVSEGEWDALLVSVMVKRMELALAYPVTKSTSLRDSLKMEFYAKGVGVLAKAMTVDGQENPAESWGDSPLIQVRG